MKKNVELLNIEVGTFRRVGKKLSIKLDRNQFRYDSVSELNELKKTTADFLPLVNIAEQEKQIELTYQLPSELQSLKNVGSENKAIKTAVAKAIMEQDILSRTSYHVSLNPANIWYYPMSHIVYAYRANELMPFYETHSPLDQYKALVLYCLTGAPYELLLDNPKETLNKLNDELIQQIQSVNSVQELKQVVAQIEDYVTYQQWQTVDKNKVKTKRSYLATLATVVIIAVIAVGLVKKNDSNKYNALADQHQVELAKANNKADIKVALGQKNWKKANQAMSKAKYSSDKKVATFLKINQYQQALNVNPKKLNQITDLAYKNDDQKKILDWKTPAKTSQKINDQLKLEKAIINYDTQTMSNQLSFVTNKKQLLRMGEAYIDHDSIQDAENVQMKLVSVGEKSGKYLKSEVQLKEAKDATTDAQKKLDDANKIDGGKDKSKDDKVKEAQSNLDSAKDKEKSAQQKVDKAKQKVGA